MASGVRNGRRRLATILIATAIIVLCLVPHLPRFRHPSIYSDDVARIADLQELPLSALLYRPFNEHLAPFFQTVSWTTWQFSGRRLTAAPVAFTVASYVPWILCMGVLGRLVYRATDSRTTALVSIALFGISPLYGEAIFWYSGSSFTWALFWTLLALDCAGSAEGMRSWAAIAVCSALAPASSTLGLLAGPLATLRLATRRSDRPWFRPGFLVPILGTLIYLIISLNFSYFYIVKSSIDRRSHFLGGLVLALRAPTALLVPTLFGFYKADDWMPAGPNLVLSGLVLLGLVLWARRSAQRGLIGCALLLVLGGYALTYCFRNVHGAHWVFNYNERFHLFPQLGMVLLIALALRPRLSRYDHRPFAPLLVATGLATVLLVVHQQRIGDLARSYWFPEQRPTMASLEHLGALCRAERVAREECIAALDPVWSYWFQREYNGLWMLPASGPVSGRPAAELRSVLLAKLTDSERKALWGGMDVSRHARPAGELAGTPPLCVALGRLVETSNAHRTYGRPGEEIGRYTMTGWPAYLDFELVEVGAPDGPPARMLCIPCGPSPAPLEIWWASPGNLWSAARSVRFRPDPSLPPSAWTLPLDRLPHWDPAEVSRIRIRFVAAPVAIGEPRLLR